jgi:cytochrome c oxidase subunit III
MSNTTTNTPAAHGHDDHGHGHNPHLAHHFDTMEQQFDSAKLGMWVFLATEILMFGGLFCAYAIYRGNHPEVFQYAHQALNTTLGATNTAILLASSLTMAWGVRCSQLNQQKGLVLCLILTLMGGFGFLGIKYVEYSSKYSHGMWVGPYNAFYPTAENANNAPGVKGHEFDLTLKFDKGHDAHAGGDAHGHEHAAPAAAVEAPKAPSATNAFTQAEPLVDRSAIPLPARSSDRLKNDYLAVATPSYSPMTQFEVHKHVGWDDLKPAERRAVYIFFQIYYCMTGLHGLHVLIGMALITWVLIRSIKGEFSSAFFTPVDLVGLYWHLVDLIWIFLFPLLYLIH